MGLDLHWRPRFTQSLYVWQDRRSLTTQRQMTAHLTPVQKCSTCAVMSTVMRVEHFFWVQVAFLRKMLLWLFPVLHITETNLEMRYRISEKTSGAWASVAPLKICLYFRSWPAEISNHFSSFDSFHHGGATKVTFYPVVCLTNMQYITKTQKQK